MKAVYNFSLTAVYSPRSKVLSLLFYRTTLCISAVFAAFCMTVCPSVTLVYCIQTAEDIVKLLSRPGSPIILVFQLHAAIPNSKGNSAGVGKFDDFRLKTPFISETVRDRPMVGIER